MTSLWDGEYERSGIPSSARDDPSGSLVWALRNWPRSHDAPRSPPRGLDVGCGTARNTAYLMDQGFAMTGFDSSATAIARARRRFSGRETTPTLLVHDLHDGLPVASGTIDLIVDTFVYKHQLQPGKRRDYRAEMARVLTPRGRVLITVAEPTDEYYGACGAHPAPEASPNAVVDPAIGVGSVLFFLSDLAAEVSDALDLEMAWRKEKPGIMHGHRYLRRTLATIWRARPTQ